MVSDAWSMGVFFRELSGLYQSFSTGKSSPLPEPSIQYAGFAIWQRQCLEEDVFEKQLSFWRQQLAGIAKRFFAPGEVAVFCELEAHEKQEAFFNCWTRKEAFIKATGQGVSFGLDNFAVSLMPGEPAALLNVAGDAEKARRWSLKK